MNNGREILYLKLYTMKKVVPYSDFNILKQAKDMITNYNKDNVNVNTVSTNNILDALRVCVLQGDISYNDICFVILGKMVIIDSKGCYLRLPKEYIDVTSYLLKKMRQINIIKK